MFKLSWDNSACSNYNLLINTCYVFLLGRPRQTCLDVLYHHIRFHTFLISLVSTRFFGAPKTMFFKTIYNRNTIFGTIHTQLQHEKYIYMYLSAKHFPMCVRVLYQNSTKIVSMFSVLSHHPNLGLIIILGRLRGECNDPYFSLKCALYILLNKVNYLHKFINTFMCVNLHTCTTWCQSNLAIHNEICLFGFFFTIRL